jgi:sulfofructose kinase
LCIGLATRDVVWQVPELPPADGRVVATMVADAEGGPAATAAVTLARLGVDVAFAGAVGDDEHGSIVRDGLAREGVDVSQLAMVPGARTARSAILVGPGGTRAIVHEPGTSSLPSQIDAGDAAWLHVDHVGYGHAPPNLGARLSIDGGNEISGLELADVALYAPTAATLHAQFGGARAALDAGAEVVVETRGANGARAYTRNEEFDVPAAPCDPVSTLGAGDVFHGALLAYLAREAPLAEALRAASTAASMSCAALDARSAIPTRAELEAALA